MSTIVLRSVKGSPLTNTEVDNNFSNLNVDKLDKSNNLSDLQSTSTARTNLGVYSTSEADSQAVAMAIALGWPMAFKSIASPSIGTSGSPTTLTAAVGAGQTQTLIGLAFANISGANSTVSAKLNKNGGTSAFLIKDALVLPGGALAVVGGDQKLVLEQGDTITAYSSVATSIDATLSYLVWGLSNELYR
jgi:hypothetical protein